MILTKPKPIQYHKRPAKPTPPAPVALTLVSATYEPGESVTLTFDRAIDLGAVRVDLLIVDDAAVTAAVYSGADAFAVGDDAVRVTLANDGDPSGAGVRLTAPATVLIRPADGGPAWAGCSGLALPFG